MFPHSFLFCSIFLFSTLVATIFASANGSKLIFPHSFLSCPIFLFSTLVATIFASANGSKLIFPHSFLFCSVFRLSILFDCSGFSLIIVLLSGIHEKFKLFTRLILSLTGFSSF
jgi:hypothetical protein